MRTTIDLPEAVHEYARQQAAAKNTSVSAVVSELAVLGMISAGKEALITINPKTGFPNVHLGRPISSQEIEELIYDD